MVRIDRRLIKNFGWTILLLTVVFCIIGLVNLYSASYHTGLTSFKKQVVWVSAGLLVMLGVSFVNYMLLNRYALHIYTGSVFLLLLVLLLGKEVSGSKSWLSLGPAAIQPSELVKIAAILLIARFYHNDFDDGPFGISDLVKPLILTALLIFLVMLQPDLGTAIMIVLISGSMFLFMGIKKKTLALTLLSLVIFAVPVWNFYLKDYQKDRIMTFVDPSIDPLGSGYNSIQSQIAVGSGKLTGKGFMSGTQTQLRFIPAQKTDFAFSVLAEEWGFIGGAVTLVIYFLLILYILDTASLAKDKFSMLTAYGIASLFFWHALINIGMVLGMLPVIGIPLLLFSYGGSSVMTSLIAIGIVLGIKMRQKPVPRQQIVL